LLFNKFGFLHLSRVVVVIQNVVAIYLCSVILGRQVTGHYFFVFMIPVICMFFEKQDKWWRFTLIGFVFFAFALLEFTQYTFFFHVVLPDDVIWGLSVSVFCITCVVLYVTFDFYVKMMVHMRNNFEQLLSMYSLTEREVEIVAVVLKGKSNKEISAVLFIEESTVKNHLKHIYKKLHVKSRAELMAKCLPVKG